MEATIDWGKYGFKENQNYKFEPKGWYVREGFPLILAEENGFLSVMKDYRCNDFDETLEISEGVIPATNQSVVLLLKAFNCPKLP